MTTAEMEMLVQNHNRACLLKNNFMDAMIAKYGVFEGTSYAMGYFGSLLGALGMQYPEVLRIMEIEFGQYTPDE